MLPKRVLGLEDFSLLHTLIMLPSPLLKSCQNFMSLLHLCLCTSIIFSSRRPVHHARAWFHGTGLCRFSGLFCQASCCCIVPARQGHPCRCKTTTPPKPKPCQFGRSADVPKHVPALFYPSTSFQNCKHAYVNLLQ